MKLIKRLEAHFRTQESTPAPFSHTYRLSIDFNQTLDLEYKLVYTGRENMLEEELTEEGFSINDDLDIKGSISLTWQSDIFRLLKESQKAKKSAEDFMEITVFDENGSESFFPKDSSYFYYLFQEMIQGVFETTKKELPLELQFVSNQKEQQKHYHFKAHFADRKVSLKVQRNAKTETKNLDWQNLRDILENMFDNVEFDEDLAIEGIPKKTGFFVELQGFWFEHKKGVVGEGIDFVKKYLERF